MVVTFDAPIAAMGSPNLSSLGWVISTTRRPATSASITGANELTYVYSIAGSATALPVGSLYDGSGSWLVGSEGQPVAPWSGLV